MTNPEATLLSALDRTLAELARAAAVGRARHRTEVTAIAAELFGRDGGIDLVYPRMPALVNAGYFAGTAWEHLGQLDPTLFRGGLAATGAYPLMEMLNGLRVLAIARGDLKSSAISSRDAEAFVRRVVVLNLDLLADESARPRAHRFLEYLRSQLSPAQLHREIADEIHLRAVQRPIDTSRTVELIDASLRLSTPAESLDRDTAARLQRYQSATRGPTPLSRSTSIEDYRAALAKASSSEMQAEIEGFAGSLRETGLGHPGHAALLRRLALAAPARIPAALGLAPTGHRAFHDHRSLTCRLIQEAIYPSTASSIWGLVRVLERGLVADGDLGLLLGRVARLKPHASVQTCLQARRAPERDASDQATLLAGAISLLGQPLGTSQGNSPTCQAARALSQWSEHAPARLLNKLLDAAETGVVAIEFEGAPVRSTHRDVDVAPDPSLDPVSEILVPHLHHIYAQLLTRSSGRGADPHQWVNPAMIGPWVPKGFVSALDPSGQVVQDFAGMLRAFYATHHPRYVGVRTVETPNPVGVFVTDAHARLSGAHAVTLLRVDEHRGQARAYFFNPNLEGRQNWGRGVSPSVDGYGEQPGECSLPFEQFAARLYAFHYDPLRPGNRWAVPSEAIAAVVEQARQSWGQSLTWRG